MNRPVDALVLTGEPLDLVIDSSRFALARSNYRSEFIADACITLTEIRILPKAGALIQQMNQLMSEDLVQIVAIAVSLDFLPCVLRTYENLRRAPVEMAEVFRIGAGVAAPLGIRATRDIWFTALAILSKYSWRNRLGQPFPNLAAFIVRLCPWWLPSKSTSLLNPTLLAILLATWFWL